MIGRKLRDVRNTNGMTLAEVAEQIGITTMYISEIERDKKIPSDEIIKNIAKIYKLKEMELFIGFRKVSEEMINEIVNNRDLFELIFKLSEKRSIK